MNGGPAGVEERRRRRLRAGESSTSSGARVFHSTKEAGTTKTLENNTTLTIWEQVVSEQLLLRSP